MGLFSSSSQASAATLDDEKLVELVCACGEKVHGIRSAAPRRVTCKHCASPLFLLPNSPYPVPRPGTRASKKSTSKSGSDGKSRSGKKKKSGTARNRLNVITFFGSLLGFLLFPFVWIARKIRSAVAQSIGWILRPLPLALLLTILALCTTGFFTYRKWQYDRAVSLLTTLPEQCELLINEGKFGEANNLMRIVAAALSTTRRSDPDAGKLLQLARELDAVQNLSHATIEEIVSQASDAGSRWSELFARNYNGHWMIVDSTSIHELDPSLARVDVSLTVNGQPARLVVDLPAIHVSEEIPLLERAIFAAKISDCVSEGRLGWKIGLDPDSVVYLTDHRLYESLHMSTGDETYDRETDRLLDQQAKRLELAK